MTNAHDDNFRRAITIKPVGGLGNQLFIYAAGLAVAQRLGAPLLIDPSHYYFPVPGETPRSFMLDWLISEDQLLSPRPPCKLSRIQQGIQRRVPFLEPRGIFQERGFEYDERIEHVGPGTELRGYFQSWRYFSELEDQLRHQILLASPVSAWGNKERVTLDSLGPWLGIHVRRGDYLLPSNAQHHGVLGRTYYENALAAIREMQSLPLVLFSDDVAAAHDLIEPIHPVTHVVCPPGSSHPIESITLMARASALVIANSSFSWWGGWLGTSSSTKVVSPMRWLAQKQIRLDDVCPPTWIQVPAG